MLNKIWTYIRQNIISGLIPEGDKGIDLIGYENYVGGRWEEIGQFQFDYMVSQGLKPEHTLLDVGCGAGRGGIKFVNYLNPGNYLGIDKEQKLIDIAKNKVFGSGLVAEKRPAFVRSDSFEFDKFDKKPDFAISVSLFTHLNAQDIQLCLKNLREFAEPGLIYYTTFFEGTQTRHKDKSHSLAHVEHTKDEMISYAGAGWDPIYIGDWGHARNQMLMKYVAV